MLSEVMPKLLTGAYAVLGTSNALAPEPNAELFLGEGGTQNKTDFLVAVIGIQGFVVLSLAATSYALVFQGESTTPTAAVAAGCVMFVLSNLKGLLNDYATKFGLPAAPAVVLCLLFAAGAYGGLHGTGWAPGLLKGISVFNVVCGVFGIVAPQPASGLPRELKPRESLEVQANAAWALQFGILSLGALLDGDRPLDGLAYASLAMCTFLVKIWFVTRECPNLGMNPKTAYPSLVLFGLTAYAVLTSSSS